MKSVAIPFVFFALRREAKPFLKWFPARHRLAQFPFPAWRCSGAFDVIVVETGIGKERTSAASSRLFDAPIIDGVKYRPSLAVAAGFAGSLTDKLTVGEVVLADEVVDENCGKRFTSAPPPLGESYRTGRLVTASRFIAASRDKEALRNQHQAVAVDMESATLARICEVRNIPFCCVRSISDDVQTDLSPSLVSLLAEGRVSARAVIGRVALKPDLIWEMWRLARKTNRAASNLARALRDLLLKQ